MIPLKDDNPTRTFPIVTIILIVVNSAVFLYELILPPPVREGFILNMAVVPYAITHVRPLSADLILYNGMTLVTAMFLHGGVLHLAGNMIYLWIFGNNIEDAMGHARFVLFYLICGLAASATQVAAAPLSKVPMIGASGAISGVLGAYLVLFPAARVLTLVFFFFFARVVPIPAVIVLGLWFLIQLTNAGQIAPGGVAWFAHIGGFVAGLLLIAAFRRYRPRHSLY